MPSQETLPFWLLGLGLVVGAFLAWRTLKSAPSTGLGSESLELSDLQEQRDEIYAELRQLGDDASASDRRALELRAAETLKRLRDLEGRAPPKQEKTRDAAPSGGGFVSRHPLLSGTLLGGGMVGLVALLIFWAQGDAQPDPVATQQAPPPSRPMEDPGFDRGEPPLPPRIQELVDEMKSRLAADPDDLATRKSLTQLLLEHSQFFQAFAEAQEILSRDPADPDGLYAAGLVRYTMGQPTEALERLTAALESDPTYIQASLIKGIIELQIGQREQAVATWEAGQASGEDYRLAHLLDLAAQGKSVEEILNTPPPRP